MFEGKTYWIVGASEGLGRALAEQLDGLNARLVLSARTESRLTDLAAGLRDAKVVPMDVTDRTDVARAVAEAGPVDGMIYSVGAYEPLAAQEWEPETIERICETNYMGAMRVLGHLAPEFARRDYGHLVLIGSLAGFTGLPGATGYGSSKAALMHAGENLYADLRKTNVKVQLVNPGFIKTRLTEKNDFNMPFIVTPDKAASLTIAAMRKDRFQTSFPTMFSWFFRAGRFLPKRWFLSLMS
ncbi:MULTISPECIES: SDR family oxidoreductase [unclassified Roseovarius]|uniref:SDR family NAD(P)-dependent oxidoreductase n=1 Tax=unclassified Roseovarius TaxID=2614913 RepID=UPI00273DD0E6|nr:MULTISPECIES: SDR family NAD(P)-dependent oxidoreductase [unclassified Roseovarius]